MDAIISAARFLSQEHKKNPKQEIFTKNEAKKKKKKGNPESRKERRSNGTWKNQERNPSMSGGKKERKGMKVEGSCRSRWKKKKKREKVGLFL